jgi:hypothetical protein
MRLVTWKLGHRPDKTDSPDGVIEALIALEPDMVVLAERLPLTARRKIHAALAAVGLKHQLAPPSGPHQRQMLVACRFELIPGELKDGTNGCRRPPSVMHAYAPSSGLDVLGLRIPDCGTSPSTRHESWEWLLHAAAALKHRHAVLVGDFEVAAGHDHAATQHQLRRFMGDGWQRAVQAEVADYRKTGKEAVRLDHAFLSPSIQRIDARYALAAGEIRLAGSRNSLSNQPALVIDLQ